MMRFRPFEIKCKENPDSQITLYRLVEAYNLHAVR